MSGIVIGQLLILVSYLLQKCLYTRNDYMECSFYVFNSSIQPLCQKREEIQRLVEFAKTYSIKADKINDALEGLGTARLTHGCKLIELLSRPQITIENIAPHVPSFQAALDKVTDR